MIRHDADNRIKLEKPTHRQNTNIDLEFMMIMGP